MLHLPQNAAMERPIPSSNGLKLSGQDPELSKALRRFSFGVLVQAYLQPSFSPHIPVINWSPNHSSYCPVPWCSCYCLTTFLSPPFSPLFFPVFAPSPLSFFLLCIFYSLFIVYVTPYGFFSLSPTSALSI